MYLLEEGASAWDVDHDVDEAGAALASLYGLRPPVRGQLEGGAALQLVQRGASHLLILCVQPASWRNVSAGCTPCSWNLLASRPAHCVHGIAGKRFAAVGEGPSLTDG